jgi:hypothetical protein
MPPPPPRCPRRAPRPAPPHALLPPPAGPQGRKHDRKAAEVEAVRVKYLALKKLTKREVLERSWGELATSRHAAGAPARAGQGWAEHSAGAFSLCPRP